VLQRRVREAMPMCGSGRDTMNYWIKIIARSAEGVEAAWMCCLSTTPETKMRPANKNSGAGGARGTGDGTRAHWW